MSIQTPSSGRPEVRTRELDDSSAAETLRAAEPGAASAEAAPPTRTKAIGGSTKVQGDLLAAQLAERLDAMAATGASPTDTTRSLERLERTGGAASGTTGASPLAAAGRDVLGAPPKVRGILEEPVADDPKDRLAAFAKSGMERYGSLSGSALTKKVIEDMRAAPDELAHRLAGLSSAAAAGDKDAKRAYTAALAALGDGTRFTGVRRSDDPEHPGFDNDMPGAAFFRGLAALDGPAFHALKADALALVDANIARAEKLGSGVGKTYAPEYAKIAADLLHSDPAGVVRQLENRKDALDLVPGIIKNLLRHTPGGEGADTVGALLGAVAASAAVDAKRGVLAPQAARDFVAAFRAHTELGLHAFADDDKGLTRAGGRLANAAASKIPGAGFIVNKLTDREAAGVDASRAAISRALSEVVEKAFEAAGVP